MSEISSYELTEWRAFEEVFPFGEIRDDYRTALVAMTNHTERKKGTVSIEDYLLFKTMNKKDEAQTPEQAKKILSGIAGIVRK